MHLAYAAGKLAQKYNIPIIMDMAENYPAAIKLWKKYNNSALKRYLFHKLKLADNIEVNSLKYMNGVITVCDEQHSRVQSLTKNILRFKTIYNTPEKNTFSKKTNVISDKITFGHHGHLTAEKKINVLLKSFILLCDLYYNSKSHNQANNIDFQLLIAGDGDCFQDLTNIANKSEFKDRITFTGNYEYAKLNKILDKIDVGVIPYEFNNFNNFTIHNKIFDFFAKGIPVIVSKAIPNANVVYSTNSGIVCDCEIVEELTHSMFEIIGNKYNYYAENSYFAFNNKYNWDIDSNNLIDFINDCIN
jgi:glycosyltransferase involved in cell wall biosynthesis